MPHKIPTYKPPGAPQSRAEADRDYNRNRRDPVLAKLYGGTRWQKFRAYIKSIRPLCESECKELGMIVVGELIHHLVDPRDEARGGPDLVYDEANVLVCCRACHNRLHANG